jgi:hypothetical protein
MTPTATPAPSQAAQDDIDIEAFMVETVLTTLFKQALESAAEAGDETACGASDMVTATMASAMAQAATGFGQ